MGTVTEMMKVIGFVVYVLKKGQRSSRCQVLGIGVRGEGAMMRGVSFQSVFSVRTSACNATLSSRTMWWYLC